MVIDNVDRVLGSFREWIHSEPNVRSAVLFGSKAREGRIAAADDWSDIDLHLVVGKVARVTGIAWQERFPSLHYCMHVVRPATGGVGKLTVLFEEGEADLVLVPVRQMRLVRLGVMLGFHRRPGKLADALNIMATIMSGGYRFLKGEHAWGNVYARIVKEMPGVRLTNKQARDLADGFLCDLLWLRQKLARGELVAAQRMLHRTLHETNVVLLHELRMRRGMPSFQQARRIENLASSDDLKAVQVSASPEPSELRRAGDSLLNGLLYLMTELDPDWRIPTRMSDLLRRY